jgi:pimeloyl-ACP methyl ester carboxylesterase
MDRSITIEGKRLAYSDRGSGDAIVLIHGYLESLLIFESLSEVLSHDFRVISVDLPGHGRSEIVSDNHTMEMMAQRICSLIDHLSVEKVLMIGHSLGGYVTLAFLELYPERLSGYCLFHSHPFADTPEAIQRRKREQSVVRAGKKHIMYPGNIEKMFSPLNLHRMTPEIDRSNEIAGQTPDEGIISILSGMITRPSRQTVMEEGKVPLLWILGMHDQYINYKYNTETVSLPQNGILATLFNSGHLGFLEEPGRSLLLIKEFAFKVFGSESRA